MKLVARFLKNESGATAIEYGLIAALISVVIIAVITSVGSTLTGVFGAVDSGLAVGLTNAGNAVTEAGGS